MERNIKDTNNVIKSILETIRKKEDDYYNKNLSSLDKKNDKIKAIIKRIELKEKNDNIIISIEKDSEILENLHELAVEPGGFMRIQYRQKIYKFIIDTIYKNNPKSKEENKKVIVDEKTKDIIFKDVERTVLYSINSAESASELKFNKKDLFQYIEVLKEFTEKSLGNHGNFDYYQGFQELSLYFMILFLEKYEDMDIGTTLLSKFSHIFLEYIVQRDLKKKTIDFLIVILEECCKKINVKHFEQMKQLTNTSPYYSLSWILTWFTHDNKNLFCQMRIMDYFITSNLNCVYFFCGNLIINEFHKFTAGKVEDDDYMGEIFKYFKNIKYEEVNWEFIIQETEKFKRKTFDVCIDTLINEEDQVTYEDYFELLKTGNSNFHLEISQKHKINFLFFTLILSIIMAFFNIYI